MLKRICILISLCVFMLALASCSDTIDVGSVKLAYFQQGTEGDQYNSSLFYRNDLKVRGADPTCIYIEKGEYAGYFFLYATSDLLGCKGIMAWKSKDLNNWDVVGVVFVPEKESFGRTSIWAPQIIYDEELDLYLLYYSALNSNSEYSLGYKYIGLCTSSSPAGPFTQYVGTNSDGLTLSVSDPFFALERAGDDYEYGYKTYQNIIDVCPFVDPVTGKKYLYYVRNRASQGATANEIFGLKMKDWFTPDYSTIKQLTTCNKTTVGGSVDTDMNAWNIDEGPFMLYAHGKYYLTFSIGATTDKEYAVCQAIGDSPLGDFEKVQVADGGRILGADIDSIWASCAGHHSFLQLGDELWIIYHQDLDRAVGNTSRGIAIDKVEWTVNSKGQYIMKAVGPTYSVQPLPQMVTGYYNVAKEANVTATNAAEGSSPSLLNDGIVKCNFVSGVSEFVTKGNTQITLSFDDYVTARAICIYNSYDYNMAFVKVEKLEIKFKAKKDGKTVTGTAYTDPLLFDFERDADVDNSVINAASCILIEFDELLIKEITIFINCPANQDGVALNEITVYGRR